MIATARQVTQSTLGLSYTSCSTGGADSSLQATILHVVNSIIEQDSTDKGAWTYVITKRIALHSTYSEQEVTREIGRMLNACLLYESCYEILFGTFPMTYVRNGNELLGTDISSI